MLEAQNARLELEGQIEHLRQSYIGRQHDLESVKAERDKYVEAFRQSALEELVRLHPEHRAAAEQLGKATNSRRWRRKSRSSLAILVW